MNFIVWKTFDREELMIPTLLILIGVPAFLSLFFRRFYLKGRKKFPDLSDKKKNNVKLLNFEMLDSCLADSFDSIVKVGLYIIFFSVLTKLITVIGIATLFAHGIAFLLHHIGVPTDFALPFFSGMFEITLGAQSLSDASTEVLLSQIAIISFTLGFNGFSVQAQVASIMAKTDIRFIPYFISRVLHGVIACILTIFLYKPLYINRLTSQSASIPVSQSEFLSPMSNLLRIITEIGPIFTLGWIILASFILLRRTFTQ